MGLISNTENVNKVTPESAEKKEKPARRSIVPALILLLVLLLTAALIAGGYWVFTNREELKERFFPPKPTEMVEEKADVSGEADAKPEEKAEEKADEATAASFFRKLIKKNRSILVRGTLLGEEGGSAVLVNKKVLPQGSMINGMRIVEITNQSIVVEYQGSRHRIQVGETFNPDDKD